MKSRLFVIAAMCLAAAGCQSGNSNSKAKMEWVQFQYGDVFDVADAKCKLFAQTQQQGLYAQGTTGFVVGAQLGNAIGNAIRMEQAYKQCMTIAGWKQVPAKTKVIANAAVNIVQCTSVAGHSSGVKAASMRTVVLEGARMSISGTIDGNPVSPISLPCMRMQTGLYCDIKNNGVSLTVMTNGASMIDNLKDAKGAEIAAWSYRCDKPFI